MALKLSLRTKLTGAHLVGVLMLLTVTVVSLLGIQEIDREISHFRTIDQSNRQISDLDRQLVASQGHLDVYRHSRDFADRVIFVKGQTRARQLFGSLEQDNDLSEADRQTVRMAFRKFVEADELAQETFDYVDTDTKTAREGWIRGIHGAIERMQSSQTLIQGLDARQKELAEAASKKAADTKAWVVNFLAALGGSAILVGLAASLALHRSITAPVRAIADAVRRLTTGDLSVRVTAKTGDEIEKLADAFNGMAQEITASREESEAHNLDLERRVVERTRELTALNVMANVAAQSLDLNKIVSDTFRKVLDLVGIESGMVQLYDNERQMLVLKVSENLPPYLIDSLDFLQGADHLPMLAFSTGEPKLIDHLSQDLQGDSFAHLVVSSIPEAKSMISIPLRAKNTTIGVMTLLSTSRYTISSNDVLLLTSIAHQIGVAAENARLYESTVNYAETIAVLNEIDRAILSTLSLGEITGHVITNVQKLISCNFISVSMLGKERQTVHIKSNESSAMPNTDLEVPIGHTLVHRFLSSHEPIVFEDLADSVDLPLYEKELRDRGIRSYTLVPLAVRGELIGALTLGAGRQGHFRQRDISLAQGLANQVAIAMDNANLYEGQKEHYVSSIRALAAAVDARDPYTAGHSERVAEYAIRIGLDLSLSEEDLQTLQFAGLLHDIGKIGIADEILKKPGPLDPAERTIMISHATISHTILRQVDALSDILLPVRHHHEWFGGGGYPDALKGHDIPRGARILAVADAFEAMTSTRPYRLALPIEAAKASLTNGKGIQFDPEIVDAFLRVVEREEAAGTDLWKSLVDRTDAAARQAQPILTEDSEDVGLIHPAQGQSLTILYKIAQEMHAILDLPLLLKRILEILSTVHGKGDYSILLKDEEQGDLVIKASTLRPEEIINTRIAAGLGITGWVSENGKATLVADTDADKRHISAGGQNSASELAVPLIVEGRTIGVLDVSSQTKGTFVSEDVRLLTAVAAEIASAIEVAQLHSKMREAAIHDGLTGLHNHRYFYDRFETELVRAERYGRPLAVGVFDVDGLKAVNDNLGHLAGDEVLKRTAQVLAENIRSCDVAARYGGDEFVVIMPEADIAEAELVVRRLTEIIGAAKYVIGETTYQLPGSSYGVAVYPAHGKTPRELFEFADDQVRAGKKFDRSISSEALLEPEVMVDGGEES